MQVRAFERYIPLRKVCVVHPSGQNAKEVTHIKGRLLDQTMILFNCVPYRNWNFSKKERIRSQRERILSFKSSSL